MWKELRGISLFRDLSDEFLQLIYSIAQLKRVKRGEILFFEGDPYVAMYVVRTGKVRLTKTTPEGREIILYIRQGGEPIGAAMLFLDQPYPATAQAIEAAEIWMIPHGELEALVRENPDLSIAIIRLLGERLLQTQAQMRDLALQDKWGALISTLLRLYEEYGRQTPHGVVLDLALSHQELAKMIGSTREGVNRMMSQLKKAGILDVSRGQITIYLVEELKSFLKDS
ncbi:Crp/Fnr family transcriptional regulator [Tumebacillus lipolyticus]|uniref:Crp/Fnr family transcriptional regulator n=1 Tax=Tumebacillus lipolyticus TaxID=1280370 RepID=A0ABW4ZUI1_9BACL